MHSSTDFYRACRDRQSDESDQGGWNYSAAAAAPFLASYDKGTYDAAPRFCELLREHVGDKATVIVAAPYGRVTEYLSERFVTSAINVTVQQMKTHPIFVVEPCDLQTRTKLLEAGLVEGPAIFTVLPSPSHGPSAIALSLHATRRR